jgi:hypothetical protein
MALALNVQTVNLNIVLSLLVLIVPPSPVLVYQYIHTTSTESTQLKNSESNPQTKSPNIGHKHGIPEPGNPQTRSYSTIRPVSTI